MSSATRPILLALALFPVALAWIAPPAVGQTYGRTVPSALQPRDGNNIEPFLFGGYEGRTQVLIARSTLRGFAKKSIRRIIVRRDAQTAAAFPNGMKGGWIDLMILASWTSRDIRNPSIMFAANHGTGQQVVYRGAYRVPDSVRLAPGTRVASLAPNVSAHIVLQTPIAYVPNHNLCLEFVHRKHATRPGPGSWHADLDVRPGGSRSTFGRSCFRSGRVDAAANRFAGAGVIGGSVVCVTRAPVTPMALLIVGASNQQWGNNKLPFDFGTMGAKNCYLFVSLDLLMPTGAKKLPRHPGSIVRTEFPLPYSRGLVGTRLFSQWWFYQPGANSLSMTTTNGASLRIVSLPGLESTLVSSDDAASSTGHVAPERALALRLEEK